MMPAIRHKANPVIEPVDIGDAAEDGLAEGEDEDEEPPTDVAVALLSPLVAVSTKTCGA
jgi:hypothetical protein